MTPLTEKQTAAYLQHWLRAAGCLKDTFSHAHARKIHERSGGLPGRINGEAHLVLKEISRHRKGFKKFIAMGFEKWGMDFRYRFREWSKALCHLRHQTLVSVRRN